MEHDFRRAVVCTQARCNAPEQKFVNLVGEGVHTERRGATTLLKKVRAAPDPADSGGTFTTLELATRGKKRTGGGGGWLEIIWRR